MNQKKSKSLTTTNSFTEFMLYKTPDGQVKVEIYLRDENIWLTQEDSSTVWGATPCHHQTS